VTNLFVSILCSSVISGGDWRWKRGKGLIILKYFKMEKFNAQYWRVNNLCISFE